ncbi:hypothetical protein ONZ45_g7460 [Pleurotus djamor]|nr:hypothetical protein ONZ45_g7460 [Pleurotus djamor]
MIFEHLLLQELQVCGVLYASRPRLLVSHVCQLWRDVALKTPQLWGYVSTTTKLELAELFIERSKSTPLYLLASPNREVVDVTTLMLRHSTRLKEIDLVYHPEYSSWLPTLEHLETPILERLIMASYPTFTTFKFASKYDPSRMPTLRHVHLVNSYFDLRTPYLSQLRSLILSFNSKGSPNPTGLDILLALQGMKLLQSLIFHTTEFTDNIPKDLVVELPELKDIYLSVKDAHVLLLLLHHLTYINVQTLAAKVTKHLGPDLTKSVTDAFRAVLPIAPASRRTKLGLLRSGWGIESTISITPNQLTTSSEQSFSFTLVSPADFSTTHALVSAFPENPPQTLHLNLDPGPLGPSLKTKPLEALMRSLTSVEVLRTQTLKELVVVMSDIPTISQTAEARHNRTAVPLSLPSLKRIEVEDQFCYERNLQDLQITLKKRKMIEAGIDVLRLKWVPNNFDWESLRSEVKELLLVDRFTGAELA